MVIPEASSRTWLRGWGNGSWRRVGNPVVALERATLEQLVLAMKLVKKRAVFGLMSLLHF